MRRAHRSPVLVGRAAERSRLDELWAEVRHGSPVIAVVTGIAGVGKTRLLEEWAAGLGSAVEVVTADCAPTYDGASPLAPLLRLLEQVRTRGLAEVGMTEDSGATSQRIAQYLTSLAATLSEPVVAVIEDVHWADASTLTCLAHLDRILRRAQTPLLLVMTLRTGEPATAAANLAFLDEAHRSPLAELIELHPLAQRESRELVHSVIGPTAARDVVADLARRGDGVPLWTEELARVWPQRGVPASARLAFDHRIGRLPRSARRILAALAVAGSANDELLFALSAPSDRLEFGAACQLLTDEGLMTTASDGDVVISHALLRDVVHDRIVPLERRRLHAAAAQWLVASDRAVPAAIAHHFESAGHDRDALVWAFRAATEAEDRGSVPEALSHLSATVALWPLVADAEELLGEKLWSIQERLAMQCSAVGDYDRSTGILMELLEQEWASRAIDPWDVARLEVAIAFQVVNWSPDHAWPHVDHAWELVAGSIHDPELVGVLSRLVRVELFGGRPDHHGDLFPALVATARRSDDIDALTEALVAHGSVLAAAADFDAAVSAFQEAADLLWSGGGSRYLLNDALVWLSECLHRAGDLDGAATSAAQAVERLSRSGDAASLINPYLLHNAAASAFERGRWNDAERWWGEARTYGRAPDDALHLLPAPLLLAQGHVADVAEIVERHRASAHAGPELARYFFEVDAALQLAEGRPGDALAAVRGGLVRCVGTEQEMWTGGLLLLGARAAHDRSSTDVSVAREFIRWLDRWVSGAPRSPLGPDAPVSIVTTTAVRAQWSAETERLRGGDTVVTWDRAVAAWHAAGRPYQEAYCCVQAARAAAARPDTRPLVAALLSRVASVAGPLVAVPLLEDAVEVARSARVPVPTALRALLGQDQPPRPFGLSPREHEVMGLVAEGLTNRQVAARLFISLSTVSVHLGHAFTKLGATSRAQATARLLREENGSGR